MSTFSRFAQTPNFNFLALFLSIILISGCVSVTPVGPSVKSFQNQKGQLPWPAQGEIIEPFGTVVNPVYGTKANNPGILISTTGSATVSSVYEGVVVDVFAMPEFGNVVTISHGDYTTVYGNLSEMYVTKGVRVREGEYIGQSGTESEPQGEALFFALFENGVEANPELWLKRR